MANIPPPSSLLASTPPASRKVAIPRLQRPGQTKSPLKERRRVTRACTACRTHKIKCTGETPQCKHCANTNRQCVYVLPRRDRLKTVTEQCVQMAGFLNELRSRVNEEDNARISDLLEGVEENISDIRQTPAPSIPDTEAEGSKGSREYGTQNTPLSKHNQVNTDSLDLLNENLQKNEQARATGFIGQNSVLQWLRTISGLQMDRSSDDSLKSVLERRYSTGAEGVSSFTFWMDGDNVDVDFYVDPYEFPAMDTAERLLSCYLTRVHDSFPILPRKPFEDQFRKYFTSYHSGNSPRVNHKWQATLNMVFAIGARYSHLVKANWRADERDHLIYHARARALVVNEYTLTEHPDVPQIQALGLVAFYWFSTGQVSRAWTIIGLAVRCAYSLGLHVRNEDPSASAAKRETLVRVWWSLYSLERTLSIVVGRPSLIVDVCCSVPLPIPVPEDQITDEVEIAFRAHKGGSTVPVPSPVLGMRSSSGLDATPRTPVGLGTNDANSGSYFKATIQLHIITQDILTSLYSAGTLIRSLNDIQQDMVQLNQRLDEWSLSLPSEFNFEVQSTPGIVFTRERMILGFQLCNAKMLLARPCLGTLGRSSKEENDSEFTKRMASICIEAARATVDLIPDQPNPLFIYDQGPWWNIVHHLMQAFSVFLLALSYGPPMSQDNNYPLAQYVKKIIRWLRTMPDPLADRAYRVALKTFIGVAAQLSMDVSDLWMENTMTASADQNFQHSGMGVNMHTQFDTMTYVDPAAMATTAYPLQPGPPFLDNQHFNTM